MKSKLTKITLVASLGLALSSIFSCYGDDGIDGKSCITEPKVDGSAYDVLCNGKKVGELSNGEKGETGAAGTSCTVQPNDDSYDVLCGGENVGQLSNGDVCTIVSDASNPWYLVTCGSITVPLAWCGGKTYDPTKMMCYDGILKIVFTDARDSMRYKAVVIGEQVWMAQNLNYAATGSKCGNSNGTLSEANTTICDIYGRLYNWATAMNLPSKCNSIVSTSDADCAIKTPFHQGVCPSGWHLPSNNDWAKLWGYVGGPGNASNYLKATIGWYNYCKYQYVDDHYVCSERQSGNGTDDYGFSALPGGGGNAYGSFFDVELYGYWWSTSDDGSSYAYRRHMRYDNKNDYSDYGNKRNLFSVRCLQD